jgi:outer membrane lipoprotein-sorting protein
MKYTTRYIQLLSIFFILTFFFSACTILAPRAPERPTDPISLEAEKTISTLKNQNLELKTFKGVGNIKIRGGNKKDITARIAWVASAPDKIRIALTSVSGQPMISLAGDGHWFYLISHSSGDFYKKSASASFMRRLLGIPVKTEDMVDILAGRVPIHSYDSAILTDNRSQVYSTEGHTVSTRNGGEGPGQNGYVLVLKKKWGDILEKIYFDEKKKNVHKVEMFDAAGTLAYRVEFDGFQTLNGYRVPSRLIVSNNDGLGFHLDVDRYWTNMSVSPSVFVLTPPE